MDSRIDRYFKEAVKDLNEVILHDKDLWYTYVINLSQHLKVAYTTVVFHQQVYNGGLHQYFFNAYGQFAYLTVELLQLIKATKAIAILEKATNLVNNENIEQNKFRTKIFERDFPMLTDFDGDLCNSLELLDDDYYDSHEDIEQLLVDYLENH